MKIALSVFRFVGGAALAVVASAAIAAAAGQAAPDFTVTDTQGKPVHLADYRGKFVVLEWTNPECPFVQRHYETRNMPGLQKEFAARDVVWLSIDSSNRSSSDFQTAPQLDAWMLAHDAAQKRVLLDADSEVAKMYGAKTTPHMFVVNPEGRIVYAGAIDDKPGASARDTPKARNYVRAALTTAMNGGAVNPANTTPYGCSVKY
jgi:peroxiredoxin